MSKKKLKKLVRIIESFNKLQVESLDSRMRAIMDIYEVRIITNMGNEEIWIYMDEDCKAIVTLGCIDGYEILNYRTPMGIDVITHGELPLRLTLV